MEFLPFDYNMNAIQLSRALLCSFAGILLIILFIAPTLREVHQDKENPWRPKLETALKWVPLFLMGLLAGALAMLTVHTLDLSYAEESWAKNADTWAEVKYGVTDGTSELALLTIRDSCDNNAACAPQHLLKTPGGLIASSLLFDDGIPKLVNAETGKELAK